MYFLAAGAFSWGGGARQLPFPSSPGQRSGQPLLPQVSDSSGADGVSAIVRPRRRLGAPRRYRCKWLYDLPWKQGGGWRNGTRNEGLLVGVVAREEARSRDRKDPGNKQGRGRKRKEGKKEDEKTTRRSACCLACARSGTASTHRRTFIHPSPCLGSFILPALVRLVLPTVSAPRVPR